MMKTKQELELELANLKAKIEEKRELARLKSEINRIKYAGFYNIINGFKAMASKFKQMPKDFNKKMFP